MEFGILLIIFLTIDAILLIVVYFLRKKTGLRQADKKYFQQKWQHILVQGGLANPGAAVDLRHALLEADKLLDLVLRKKGYSGTLGEKLKKSGSLFSSLNDVWFAHKLRNRIAHELELSLDRKQMQRALRSFEQALRDLKAL